MSEQSSRIIIISSGVTSSGLELTQTAQLIVLNGGTATEICAADSGSVVVSSGGVLTDCTVSSGGTTTVLNSGYAENITVDSSGLYYVSSGGTAHQSLIQSGGTQIVYADTMAASATVMDGGVLLVNSDGRVRFPIVSQGGSMYVSLGIAEKTTLYGTAEIGGVAQNTEIQSGGRLAIQSDGWTLMTAVSSGGSFELMNGALGQMDTIYDGGIATVSSGGILNNTAIKGGTLEIKDGGQANYTNVAAGGNLLVSSGGTALGIVWTPCEGSVSSANGAVLTFASQYFGVYYGSDNKLLSHNPVMEARILGTAETMYVMSGGTTIGTTVCNGGRMDVFNGGKLTGIQTFESGAAVSMLDGAILDFNIAELTTEAGALVNNLAVIQGMPIYTLTVSGEQAKGVYTLAEGASDFSGTITVQDTSGISFGTLIVGESLLIGEAECTLALNESALTFTVNPSRSVPENLIGTADRVSWDPTGAKLYALEYSTDAFAHVLEVVTPGSAVDTLNLPCGTYQWRVKDAIGEEWAVGEDIVSENDPAVPKVLRSIANGDDDIFFATPVGTWSSIYYAQHVGSVKDWTGTNELVSANGKGRIQNIFFGSADPNVLCLTDGENGDAIFVDDVYTELPDEIEEQTARLYKIQEIWAGAGDDIVDMTSQRFEYIGDGLTIRGGDGNDTIWANKGDNLLFGDAGNDRIVGASGNDVFAGGIGNDRMHGGGGSDIFTFCENWGVDNVEQLAGGSVTLWFASGSMENWDKTTLTYTDGNNSVKVSGVTADKISLKFGDDGFDQFATLSSMGAFFDATSERIFEEPGKGILASL